VTVRQYLIHRGDWPVPQGLRPEARLVPPAQLLHLDTTWSEAPLGAEDRERKRAAIAAYRSQMAVMRRFLTSFLRQDELFGTLPPAELPALAPVTLSDRFPPAWLAGGARLVDARQDTLVRQLDPKADLIRVDALADHRTVYLRLAARGRVTRRYDYLLRLHPIATARGDFGPPMTIDLDARPAAAGGIRIERDGEQWRVAVPRARLGWPGRLLVGAEVRLGRVSLDRLSWRVLRLPGGGRGRG
jgi:hypothetical protein